MPSHTAHTRDAALRQLHRINRWLIAGSVALTGVFAEVAANAFPGTTKAASVAGTKRSGAHTASSSKAIPHSLRPPAHAPRASTESSSTSKPVTPSQESPAPSQAHEPASSQEPAPAHESAPSQEAAPAVESAPAPESAPAHEAAPTHEPSTATESPPTHESPPAEESAPVVSGGS